MKIKNRKVVLLIFASILSLAFVWGDDCDALQSQYNYCIAQLNICTGACYGGNPTNTQNCLAECDYCDGDLNAYNDCISNSSGGSQCEIQPDGSGNCAVGYQNNGAGCCESRCSGDKVYDLSIDDCTGCAEGTIANPGNTKCICDSSNKCCGIQLNTVVPFIGDCIELDSDSSRGDTTSVNSVTAFPILMQGLMKILMSAIMVFSFIMVIVSGLMITAGAVSNNSFSKGKTILKNVLISLILLGCSGLILSLINPSFFGG